MSSVCGETFSTVKTHSYTYFGYNEKTEYSFEWAKNILLQIYNRNPFVDSIRKKQLHLLSAVDEFSKFTDLTRRRIYPHSRSNGTFTGFCKEMVTLTEAPGAVVLCKTLSLCDFAPAKPLLK